jgi:hypothetical protein
MKNIKVINVCLMVLGYFVLMSNVFSGHEAAETAHYLFIVLFIIVIAIKFIDDKIGMYLLIVLLSLILLHRFFL